MMTGWWEHSQKGVTNGRTDGRTDGQTDGQTDWTIHRAAWSQLKIYWLFGIELLIRYASRSKGDERILAATKQLLKHFFPSVCLSFCPSARPPVTPIWLCSHQRIILKISGVITIDRRDVHAKGQCQRSKVKVTEVMTPYSRFRTVTPVWINIWKWNDVQGLMLLRRGALLFFKVILQISRSHG